MPCSLNGYSILHVLFYACLRAGQPGLAVINGLRLDQQLGKLWRDICVFEITLQSNTKDQVPQLGTAGLSFMVRSRLEPLCACLQHP